MTDIHERQRAHLRAVIGWAQRLRGHLGETQDANGERVHFRPCSTGVTMVGLLPDRPQRGRGGYSDLASLAERFEAEHARWCRDVDQGRPTPEKRLQSFLLADAHTHGGVLSVLSKPSEASDDPVRLELVTDELAVPADDKRRLVCDLLALRMVEGRPSAPVVLELKSSRKMARLLKQVDAFAELVEEHLALFAELSSVLLGRDVELAGPCERWIVWPALPGGELREDELAAVGVRVVGYRASGVGYAFTVGRGTS